MAGHDLVEDDELGVAAGIRDVARDQDEVERTFAVCLLQEVEDALDAPVAARPVSTAFEIASLLERLDAGALLSESSTIAALQHLRDQQDHQQLPRWLPYHEHYQRSGLKNELLIWNKTGQMTGVRTDAAIFSVRSVKWVVASFTRDSIDHSYRLEHEGVLLNARAGLALYDAWGRPALEED